MRAKLCMIHWNHLKQEEAAGARPVVKEFYNYIIINQYNQIGKKSYVNPTHKRKVWRKVRKTATHTWRNLVKRTSYQVNYSLFSQLSNLEKILIN